jgi:hypothetical protein
LLSSKSDDALAELVDFNEQGEVVFKNISDAAQQSANDMAAAYQNSLSGVNLGVPRFARGIPPSNDPRIQAFDVGTPRIQNDGIAMLHKDEMVIDAKSADVLRNCGVDLHQAGALDTDLVNSLIATVRENTRETINLQRMIRTKPGGVKHAA